MAKRERLFTEIALFIFDKFYLMFISYSHQYTFAKQNVQATDIAEQKSQFCYSLFQDFQPVVYERNEKNFKK